MSETTAEIPLNFYLQFLNSFHFFTNIFQALVEALCLLIFDYVCISKSSSFKTNNRFRNQEIVN